MPTKNKTTRRMELLQAARQVLAEKGFEATTISEIVARAGVAQGTFYLYFPSKIAVVVALEEEVQEQIETAIRAAFASSSHVGELIEQSVSAVFRILGEQRDILHVIHSGVSWREAPSERQRIFAPYYALIAELIRHMQVRGEIDHALHPETTAVLIVGTVYYAADECYLYQSNLSPENYVQETVGFVCRALGVR